MPQFKDLTGQRFTRLVAREFIGRDRNSRQALWLCDCDCGEKPTISGAMLSNGSTQSCGCLGTERRTEAATKHGHAKRGAVPSRTYASYNAMMKRCYKENVCQYPRYGGRGITVAERWRGEHGFINFLADMGERPEGKTLDRKEVNGNYEPSNCRWATSVEQQNNRRI